LPNRSRSYASLRISTDISRNTSNKAHCAMMIMTIASDKHYRSIGRGSWVIK